MIYRIYVIPKNSTHNGKVKSFNELDISGRVESVKILDSYLIDSNLSKKDLHKVADLLINKNIEEYSIDSLPETKGFSYVLEIGFRPGVTDNVAHTVKEEIRENFKKDFKDKLAVYTSKVFLFKGKLKGSDLDTIALSLCNPLIERFGIWKIDSGFKMLPKIAPKVSLKKKKSVTTVSLRVPDSELIDIGKFGIKDKDGSRRGPLALDFESMKVIQGYFEKLGRDPNDIELESLAQTWSEHCKHTIFANSIDDVKDGLYKTYIKGATNKIRKEKGKKDFCVSVFSDNAGAIIFDKDYMVTHKVETHNSPSALDPYGGAITGIVGVNRDTIGFGMGAKPVANLYGFCFGNPEDKSALFKDKKLTQKMLPPARIMDGVIKGINMGGNCSGIPTTTGFTKYDDRYRGKPLVFAGTVGISPMKVNNNPAHEKSAKPGDYVVMVGGRVGADGIHGATFSSVVMDSSSPATAVQIGDPITQKKLSDAIVKEARDMGLYNSITDNGAGGLSCSAAEMAKECGGVIIDIDKVPLKYPGLTPWEIWISESQERMTLSVPKNKWRTFYDLMKSRGVEATVVGEFTSSGKCIVRENKKVIMDMEMKFLHNGLPIRQLVTKKKNHKYKNPKLPTGYDRTKEFLKLIKNKNLSGYSFISDQYDHEVQAGSILKPTSGKGRINTDAQAIRPVLDSQKAVLLSMSTYPSYSDIDTYHMSTCAIDTAVRNTIASGGSLDELAILDNFCWCSSDEPERLGELLDAVRACYDGAVAYGTPFISGKDSMFNDFKGYTEKGKQIKISIPPTLLISSISVIPDYKKIVSPEFKFEGDFIYVIGETNSEVGASEYYKMLGKNKAIGNTVPKVDFVKNKKAYKALEKAIKNGLLASSISVSSGGLGVALAKASVGGELGVSVDIKSLKGNAKNIDEKIFSESQGRVLVSVAKSNVKKFENLMKGVPLSKIGKTTKDHKFIVKENSHAEGRAGKNVIATSVKELAKNYHAFSNKMK